MDNILHRKERLIITTIDIIDDIGIQGLSTREIAKRQNVSEATIFRHFVSKNDLLLSVLDFYSKFDDDIYQSAKMKKLPPTEAIRFLLGSIAEYYENYPAITSITQIFDVFRYIPELCDKVNNILDNRFHAVKDFILAAQDAGEISSDADSNIITEIILGILQQTCLTWRVGGKTFSLKERILSALNYLLDSICVSK